jgi:leucyl/phenylalanyl-tRNA--protein transferase
VRQLQRWQFGMIDCQIQSAHLDQFGAESISRSEFISLLNQYCNQTARHGLWTMDVDLESDIASNL